MAISANNRFRNSFDKTVALALGSNNRSGLTSPRALEVAMMRPSARQYAALPSDQSSLRRHRCRRLRLENLEEIAAANSLQDLLLGGLLGGMGSIVPTQSSTSDFLKSPDPVEQASRLLVPVVQAASLPSPVPTINASTTIDPTPSKPFLPTTSAINFANTDLSLIGNNEPPAPASHNPPANDTAGNSGGSASAGIAPSISTANTPAAFDPVKSPEGDTSVATPNAPPATPTPSIAPTTPTPSPTVVDSASIRSAFGNGTIKLNAHGHHLESVFSAKTSAQQASHVLLPYGLVGFQVTDVKPGAIAKIDLTLPNGARPSAYYKQDPHSEVIRRFDFNGETGALVHGNKVTLYIRDGGRGDDDGIVNGVVVDPGGPGEGGGDGEPGGDPGSAAGLVISQVYGAGGATGATFNRDFVELFNGGNSSITLTGRSVQYAAAGSGNWQAIALSGSVAPGHYYLIGGATGAAGQSLPAVDLSSTVNLAAADGKVALVSNTTPLSGAQPTSTSVTDLVGYGAADWFEGTAAAPSTDAALATLRLGHGNCDTNDNLWDFNSDLPNPRNSSAAIANRKPTLTMAAEKSTPINTPTTLTGISVADPDAGSAPVEITVSGDSGTVTLASTFGLTFSYGDGTTDASMTFTGSLTSANAALNGLVFAPASGYQGSAFVTVSLNDLGNTGAGGALFVLESSHIVADGPVVALNDTVAATEDKILPLNFLVNDAWIGSSPSVAILSQPSHGSVVYSQATFGWTYTPYAEYHGSDSFMYQLSDGLGHTDSATVSLTVANVNDARIETTGDPNMYSNEGELVNVHFNTPDATISSNVTWAATGLPVGLTISASTGVISGQPWYSEAGTHAVTLTANYPTGDTNQVALSWNIADTNRISWMDDQFSQAGENVSIPLTVVDVINTGLPPIVPVTEGLPAGVTFSSQIPDGVSGTFNVTVSATRDNVTDVRNFTWTIYPKWVVLPLGVTPVAGRAAFALSNTFVHCDDVGLVDQRQSSKVKAFITQLDYDNIENNDWPIKLQVMFGGAGLTIDPNDPVGSSSIIVWPNAWPAGEASFAIIGHVPSTSTDDVIIGAFRLINNLWVRMDGDGKDNFVDNVKVGTGLKTIQDGNDMDIDVPDHMRDGIIDAKTTPKPMFDAKMYRIPPRSWTQTDLWVTKVGKIGAGKFLFLAAGQTAPDNDAKGRVRLWNAVPYGPDGDTWVELQDGQFTATTNPGEETTKIWIRGHDDGEKVFQTEPGVGNAGQIKLMLLVSPDKTKFGDQFYVTDGFSVAAIPVAIEMKKHAAPLFGGDLEKTDGLWWPAFGASYEVVARSDSGNVKDLIAVTISEKIARVPIAGATFAQYKRLGGVVVGKFNPGYDPNRPVEKPLLDVNANSAGYQKTIDLGLAKARLVNSLKKEIDTDGIGIAQTHQHFVFFEPRTGWSPEWNFAVSLSPLVVKESGFAITYNEQKYSLTLSKVGFANNGAEKGIITAADGGPFLDEYK
jgi:Putative Ig domain/Lamin Tail Domain/Bacterial Ig domain